MVTFQDLPFEIRHKIIEQALPDFAASPRCTLYSAHLKFRTAFCKAVLSIATISRSSMEATHYSLEQLEKQELRLMYTYSYGYKCLHAQCRACSTDRWDTLKMARKCLQAVMEVQHQEIEG